VSAAKLDSERRSAGQRPVLLMEITEAFPCSFGRSCMCLACCQRPAGRGVATQGAGDLRSIQVRQSQPQRPPRQQDAGGTLNTYAQSPRPNHSSYVRAIDTVSERNEFSFRFQVEVFRLCQELADDLLVFLNLKTARAVHKSPSALDSIRRRAKQLRLLNAKSRDFPGSQAPAQLHAPPYHAGVGAWNIDQDSVEQFVVFRNRARA